MRAYGITETEISEIVEAVSAERYSGNIRTENLRSDGTKRSPGSLFTIRPRDSRGPGSRFSAGERTGGDGIFRPSPMSTRAICACSWDAHGYVLAELFRRFPDARVKSASSDYRSAADFHAQTGNQYQSETDRAALAS